MYSFDSKIRYSEVDSEGYLTPAALINYFQDCTTFHSEEVGNGIGRLKELHQTWVLNAWQIEVERYPRLCDKVTIGTIPYEMKAFMGLRNFFLQDEQGNVLVKANSVWTLIDLENGRPMVVPEDMKERYALGERLEMDYAPRKIAVPAAGEKQAKVVVEPYHLDTNYHVNNQQFLTIALSFLPGEKRVCSLRAEYRKQAFLGDVLVPEVLIKDEIAWVTLANEDGQPYMIAEVKLQSGQ